jgi:hypothetical protein
MPSIEAVIAGAVRYALEIGNGVLRSIVSRKTRVVFVALMLAPGHIVLDDGYWEQGSAGY